MITFYFRGPNSEQCSDLAQCSALVERAVWIDLFEPTPEEEKAVETALGINVPTREDMREIEPSARLYTRQGALFMTTTLLVNVDVGRPATSELSFILDPQKRLVTVRYTEPQAFRRFREQYKDGSVPFENGYEVLDGLITALAERLADILEQAGLSLDAVSKDIFGLSPAAQLVLKTGTATAQDKTTRGRRNAPDFGAVLVQLGKVSDLIGKERESVVSLARLLSFLTEELKLSEAAKATRSHLKSVVADLSSLGEYADFLSNKINFLLDTTLGLINIEQNGIIKIVSVAAVVFLPPTLVASIYGMNFELMPELKWLLGYPFALLLMVASAILPYLYFKRKGWL
jgi:magnesium transporter